MAYLTKKIEQAHVVWFEGSNQWVKMDEQQWLIFCFYRKGIPSEKAIQLFLKKFNFEKYYTETLVKNIYQSLSKLTNPNFSLPNFSNYTKKARKHILEKYKTHHYSFNGKSFSISYGSPFLEQYVHFPLAHLEVEEASRSDIRFELFTLEKSYIIRSTSIKDKCLAAPEPGQIKRLLYIELANLFYSKQGTNWMAHIHGSAVMNNDEVLILSSAGGSGKSTMAGLLLLNGFGFFSDDFIPIQSSTKKAFPFPAALCLKNESINLLESKGLSLNHSRRGKLAYAINQSISKPKPVKVNKIVFTKFAKGKDLEFRRISILEAIGEFMQETWVGDDLPRAKRFINWFTGLQFYRLEYGNNQLAIEELTELIEKR